MPNGNLFTSGTAASPLVQMIAPDIAAQQLQLSRQQQMADILRQQSLSPMGDTQVVNGWALQKSPFEGLAKVLQGYMAGKNQQGIDAKNLELSKALGERMGEGFDAMSGGSQNSGAPQTDTNQPAAPGLSASSAASFGLPATAATPGPITQPAINPQVDNIRRQAKAAYLMGNTDLANKLLENIATLTNEQKNMTAMGQDPLEMGRYATAAAHKGSILEMQPGTTALDLTNGQERFQPKVGEGIGLNNGVASAIPGYAAANASIAGALTGAQEAAKLPYQSPTTVNTATGPRLMTPQQQIIAATGMQVPTSVQVQRDAQAGRLMVGEAGGMENAAANLAEIDKELGNKNLNPTARSVLQGERNRLAAGINQPQQAGMPLMTPEQDAVNKAKGEAAIGAAKIQAQAEPLLNVINQARAINSNVPYGPWGMAEGRAALSSVPGLDHTAATNGALWNQMMGQSILSTISSLASAGGIRMDIPIVKEIQKAGGIPMSLPPEARARMLDQLESEIKSRSAAAQNVGPNLNAANMENTASSPMVGTNQPAASPAPVTSVSKSGKPIVMRNGRWEYQ